MDSLEVITKPQVCWLVLWIAIVVFFNKNSFVFSVALLRRKQILAPLKVLMQEIIFDQGALVLFDYTLKIVYLLLDLFDMLDVCVAYFLPSDLLHPRCVVGSYVI